MKHKLIMENWRRFVIKESEEKLKEFYHGTTFPMESFIQGIDSTRAQGHGQGAGFYLYVDKANAIDHASQLASGEMFKGLDGGDSADGKPIIVVVNPPFTPENFDIDFEAFGNSFGMFILNNIDYFAQNHQELGIGSKFGFKPDQVLKLAKDGKVQFSNKKRSTIMFPSADGINPIQAVNISQTAKKLSDINPEMYRKFEESVLSNASAVKYNGTEKIFPLRIEDLEGNVLWSRS